jgi:hypothetical protein
MTIIAFLLRETVGIVLRALMQPTAEQIRQIVREEMDRAAVLILDPLDEFEQENEVSEPKDQ